MSIVRDIIAFVKKDLLPPPPRLVGIQTYNGTAYNPFTESTVRWSATLQLLIDHKGRRTVKASDSKLKDDAIALAWIRWGTTPHGMVIAA